MFVGNGTTYTQDNAIILGTNTDIDFYTGATATKRLTIGNTGLSTFRDTLEVYNSGGGPTLRITSSYTGTGSGNGFHIGTSSSPMDVAFVQNENAAQVFYTNNGTSTDERMRISSGGQVTIQSPTSGVALLAYGRSNEWTLQANASSTTSGSYGMYIAAGTNSSDQSLSINNYNGATNYFKVRGDGNVGIGVSSPNGLLSLKASVTNTPMLLFQNANGGPNSAISAYTSAAQSLIGIGTNSYIDNTSNISKLTAGYEMSMITFDEGTIRMQTSTTGGSPTIRFTLNSSGNLGLSRVSAGNTLEVNGDASKTTAGSWAANSDINIKTDINTIDGALDRINKVRLVSFKYKDAYKEANNGIKDKYYHNVIAQEFQEIYPDYVYDSGDVFEEHKVLQVDTNPMYVDSVSAIQELSKMVIDLQNQINELKNK